MKQFIKVKQCILLLATLGLLANCKQIEEKQEAVAEVDNILLKEWTGP